MKRGGLERERASRRSSMRLKWFWSFALFRGVLSENQQSAIPALFAVESTVQIALETARMLSGVLRLPIARSDPRGHICRCRHDET
jgi:hypothetical protein